MIKLGKAEMKSGQEWQRNCVIYGTCPDVPCMRLYVCVRVCVFQGSACVASVPVNLQETAEFMERTASVTTASVRT